MGQMGFQQFALKIRRREGSFYKSLYSLALRARHVECPVMIPLHRLLYYERRFRKSFWHYLKRVFYYEPLFKSVCKEVGRKFRLINGIPLIEGHLDIYIGQNVTVNGITTLSGATVCEKPALYVGDGSYIGYQVMISVGPCVKIGRHVLIADRVSLIGYDGHPQDPVQRLRRLPAPKENGLPIVIGDNVWICSNATVLKGVTIGEGAIVAAQSVVTADVPPHTVVAGNPAHEVKRLTASSGPPL
ncbi:MAG TPA: acyltransferase [Candidatus Manganitrophaceae bacterium]|nr:acyltransferase [Candidatus Manganitrophaceae bacterium]